MTRKKNIMLTSFLIFIAIQPLIDVVASIMVRFQILPITIGVIIRGSALLIMFFYILFFSKSKNKGKAIKYTLLYLFFCIFYFAFKIKYIDNLFMLYSEAANFIKYSYFPLMLVFLIVIYDDLKFNFNQLLNIYTVNISVISFIIILAVITNTSFQSYNDCYKVGEIGWFYAANDIGSIMAMLFPFLMLKIYKTGKYIYILLTIPVIYVMLSIGTKVAFGGMLIPIVLLLIYSLFLHVTKKEKVMKQTFCKYMIILFIMVLFLPNSAIVDNTLKDSSISPSCNPLISNTDLKSEALRHNKYILFLLSERDKLLLNILDIYSDTSLGNKLFGVGFTNRVDINDARINHSIELDFFTILLRLGIVGFVIYIIPMIYIFYIAIFNSFKHIRKSTDMLMDSMVLKLSIILGLGVSFLSGHVLGSPSVSIYLAITMCIYFNYFKTAKSSEVDQM